MGVAAPREPVGVHDPSKFGMGISLLDNCFLENKFHKYIRVNTPPPPPNYYSPCLCIHSKVPMAIRVLVVLSSDN